MRAKDNETGTEILVTGSSYFY